MPVVRARSGDDVDGRSCVPSPLRGAGIGINRELLHGGERQARDHRLASPHIVGSGVVEFIGRLAAARAVDDEENFVEEKIAGGLRETHRGIQQRQGGNLALENGSIFDLLLAKASVNLVRFHRHRRCRAVHVHFSLVGGNGQGEVEYRGALRAQEDVLLLRRTELRSVYRQLVFAGERNSQERIVAGAVSLDRAREICVRVAQCNCGPCDGTILRIFNVSLNNSKVGLGEY